MVNYQYYTQFWNEQIYIFLETYLHGDLQYAELDIDAKNHQRLRQNSNETGISSILVYQADHVVIENESPEYTRWA